MQRGSLSFYEGRTDRILMGRKVVQNDHVARPEGRAKNLTDVFAENILRGRAINGQAACGAVETNRGYHRRGIPMPVWGMVDDALAAAAPSSKAGHIGFRTGFINKHQALGIEVLLSVYPFLPALVYISPILFAGQ